MKKSVVAIVLAGVMLVALAGCEGESAPSASGSSASAAASANTSVTQATADPESDSYEAILDEYSAKMKELTPKLVEQYKSEAASLDGDVSALATLSSEKTTELAEVNSEGVSKMADLMIKEGSDYAEYEDWSNELTEVYLQEAQKISDAYLASAS